jgi:hypothetical protein
MAMATEAHENHSSLDQKARRRKHDYAVDILRIIVECELESHPDGVRDPSEYAESESAAFKK